MTFNPREGTRALELKDYWSILMRRRFVISITLILTILATAVGTQLVTPRYEASATLRVATVTSGSVDYIDYDLNYADRLNQLPLGIIGIALATAILPSLSKHIADDDRTGAGR